MRGFIIRYIVTGISVLVASQIIPGITVDDLAAGVVAVLVLAFLNALIRPILYFLSVPFIVLTLGLFMVIINAFLLHIVGIFVKGFHVEGFWSAVGGAILISLMSTIFNLLLADDRRVDAVVSNRPRKIRQVN